MRVTYILHCSDLNRMLSAAPQLNGDIRPTMSLFFLKVNVTLGFFLFFVNV